MQRGDFPYVKVCGVTDPVAAIVAAESGAYFVGLVFYERSPRFVSISQVTAILQCIPPHVTPVAVLVDPSLDQLTAVWNLGIRTVQLSGRESPESLMRIRERWPELHMWKSIHVGEPNDLRRAEVYRDLVDGFLVDTYRKGVYGGTGHTFPWTWLQAWPGGPYLLAGGISEARLPDAWRWWLTHTACVGFDLSSALESAPGKKDLRKIRSFFQRWETLKSTL